MHRGKRFNVSKAMLSFTEFVEELGQTDVRLTLSEVAHMRQRFGDETLAMGHVQNDGSLLVPVDCLLEAAGALGARTLSEAATALKSDGDDAMLPSVAALISRVSEARRQRLSRMVESFQAEPNSERAHQHWKQIENMIFGVEYDD